MDEDPAGYKRWISRKEIQSAKILLNQKMRSCHWTSRLLGRYLFEEMAEVLFFEEASFDQM